MDSFPLRSSPTLTLLAIPASLFAGTFAVYLSTLCPTVYVGDSGEFITNALTLGINHPTGYPLYTLLGRAAIIVTPFAAPAVAMNALSALAASLTTVCLFFIMRTLTLRIDVAAATALLFGFSATFWSRATSAEVYGMNAFFIALSFLVILRWFRDRDAKQLLLAAYVAGLGLSQHTTGALAAFSMILFILLTRPGIVREVRTLLLLTAAFAAGFTVYLYLPIRAVANPPIAWGDFTTIGGFLHHLLPVGRKGLAAYLGGETEGRFSWLVQQAFTREFWYFAPVAVLGIVALLKQWRLLLSLFSVVTVNILFTISRKMPLHADFDAYFIPTYFVIAVFMGLGLARLLESVEKKWRSLSPRVIQRGFSTALLLIVLTTAYTNYSQNNRSRNYFGHDFGYNLYQPIEQNAIVFTIGDEQTFLGWYFKYVEKHYPGVTFIDTRLLGTPWGVRLFDRELQLSLGVSDAPDRVGAEIIRSNVGRRPIYFTHRLPWGFLSRDYEMLPIGMLIQILPKGSPLPYRRADFTFHPGWETVPLDDRCSLLVDFYPKEYVDHAQFWLDHQNIQAAQAELDKFFSFPYRNNVADIANALLLQSLTYFRSGQTTKAIAYTDSALALSPSQWRALEYRGNFRFLQKDTAGAVKDWEASLRLNPGNTAVRNILNAMPKKRS